MTDADTVSELLEPLQQKRHCLLLTHTNPDPDAIASAWALSHLVTARTSMAVSLGYDGTIGRAENRAMVDELSIPLEPVTAGDLSTFDCLALVDTQPGAGNNVVPADYPVDIVIDHHSPRRTWQPPSPWCDIDGNAAATSLIALSYLDGQGITIPSPLATALLYGLVTDTGDFCRSDGDDGAFTTYLRLLGLADLKTLAAIRRPSLPRSYYRTLTEALEFAQLWDERLVTLILPAMPYPDLTAEMADFLARMERVELAFCVGCYGERLYMSLRSNRADVQAASLLSPLVGDDGSAGGHGAIAGGTVSLTDPAEVLAQGRSFTSQLAAAIGCQQPPEYLVPLEGG